MTVTIDPSDMRPTARTRAGRTQAETPRPLARQILLAGLGGASLIAFTAGAFSFFSGLADTRVKPARPSPVAAAWPDLKDGVPALTPRSVGDAAATATIFNLPRPDETGPPRAAAASTEFRLRDAPQAQAEAAPATPERSNEPVPAKPAAIAAAPPVPNSSATLPAPASKPAAPAPVAAAQPSAKPPADASARKPMPQIENAEIVTSEAKPTPVLAPTRTAAPIAPSRAESIRARSAEPSAFVSLPPEPARAETAKSEPKLAEPKQAEAVRVEPNSAGAEPPKSTARIAADKPAANAKAAAKSAPAKSAAVKPAVASAKPIPVAPAPRPVMQASAAPAPAGQDADDPEVMGVKIPGSRHVRDGWKAVFGGTQQN